MKTKIENITMTFEVYLQENPYTKKFGFMSKGEYEENLFEEWNLKENIKRTRILKDKNEVEDQTLTGSYLSRTHSIERQVMALNNKLSMHQESFKKDPSNYKFIGDLDRVEHMLKQINQFIKV